jgi:tetratricopeptide (TPR) repeat protein
MLNQRCQHLIVLLVSLIGLTGMTGFCQAEQSLSQANPKSLAHYIMAVVHDYNGDNEQAIEEYRKSAQFDRKQPMPHLRLGAYYARLGRMNEAVNELKMVVKLDPDISQAHYLLALIYSSQKKYDLAASHYEFVLRTASENSPNNIEIHAYLAQLYYALHKNPQAIEQLNRILEIQPKNTSSLYLLGSIYLDEKNNSQAKHQFKKILSLQPDHAGALNSLAYIYAQEGVNLDEALKMVKTAIDLDPVNGAYYDTLGWVLHKQGLNSESLMALEKALQYASDPVIYEHMGDVYKASNDPAMARKYWLKSLNMDSQQSAVSQKLQQLNRSSAKMQGEAEQMLTK